MSLDQIAIRNNTDKSTRHHGYTLIYEQYFEPIRNNPVILLEIGCGGYHHKNQGYAGAKTWAEYFPKGLITTIDIHEKDAPPDSRIAFAQGSQDDAQFLTNLVAFMGIPDIIIDDGSHISPLTVRSFQILWPMLAPGGIYVIEDLEASYWTEPAVDGTQFHGGIDNPGAILNFLKKLVDVVNYKHSGLPDQGIESIHFHEKIVFLKKRS